MNHIFLRTSQQGFCESYLIPCLSDSEKAIDGALDIRNWYSDYLSAHILMYSI